MTGCDRTALLATHIDPRWEGPDSFQDTVERYLAEDGYDDFVCISNHEYNDGDFDDRADRVIYSIDGDLEEDEVDGLLDSYDSFLHIGAYWGRCHYRTFADVVEGVADRDGSRYTIEVPFDGVVLQGVDSLVLEDVLSEDGFSPFFTDLVEGVAAGRYGSVEEMVPRVREYLSVRDDPSDPFTRSRERDAEQEVLEGFVTYSDVVHRLFHEEDAAVAFDEESVLSWTFTPRERYDAVIDAFLDGGDV